MVKPDEEKSAENEEEGLSLFIPIKKRLESRVRVYALGSSFAVLIPKAWLEIFRCDDEEGKFWVERDIDGATITIKPPERS